MRNLLMLSAVAAIFVGCGGTTTHYDRTPPAPAESHVTTVYSGGGDVVINDTHVGEGGTYIQNADGTVTYTDGDGNSVGRSGDNSSGEALGDYPGESADPAECADAGYFYCTIQNKCLDQPKGGGSCTSSQAMSIGVRLY